MGQLAQQVNKTAQFALKKAVFLYCECDKTVYSG
jgi:hypothetical protein